MGKVDLSVIFNGGLITLPHLLPFKMKFDLGAIIAVVVIFLVSVAETIDDTSALVNSGLNREVTEEEIFGSLACDGFCSSISSLPESVLGGCTMMMFGTILTSGIEMISKAGFNQRNVTFVA